MKWSVPLVMLGIVGAALGQDPQYRWSIPAPFPKPPVPADNAMSDAKVELGRRLFYDNRMSVTGDRSCASCHRPELAFTDGSARAEGATGELHPRGSMSLADIGYVPALTWANPNVTSLEDQALVPMLSTTPVELGLKGREERFLAEISRDTLYRRLFARAFPGRATPYTMSNVTRAIAAFERTIVSMGSPYDRYRYGREPNAISESAKRGELFFFSGQRGSCFQCHGGWNFSDGSIATLGDVLDHYAAGGRTIVSGPNAGVGRDNPNKAPAVHGFTMTEAEKRDLIAFLESLTDSAFLRNPALSNPWK